MKRETIELRVKSSSVVNSVAGCIAKSIDDGKDVVITAIGASAVNQAVKAIALARGYVGVKGFNLNTSIGFASVEISDKEVTAIKFKLLVE